MQAGFDGVCLLCCPCEACIGNTAIVEQVGVDAATTFLWQPWPEPVTGFGLVCTKGHPAWWCMLNVIWFV